ncbi:MAG: lytic transglycosylase domain-containing protein [Fimbriimonadaceae bacterium]|nr:lytic transglycosylase domain-containing protein [Chitinophagales bacterium]
MKPVHYILIGAVAGILLVTFLSYSPTDTLANTNNVSSTDTLQSLGNETTMAKYFAIKLPKQLTFAGEDVPMHDFEVRERLDRELLVNTYWHSNTLQNLKLAHRWFPQIEKIFAENGIPDDFKYIALAESGLRNVISPAKAEGIWQFLSETGKQYGLRINGEVDERYDIEKATYAAVKYFKEAQSKFNNWTLSAASYNAGIGGIENNLEYQKVNNYYDLYLNAETSRYIFRILAFKVIYENTEKFGFMLDDEDLYQPLEYKIVDVNESISNLSDFAIINNTNYKMLKYYNPWLQSTSLTVKNGEKYIIKLPDAGEKASEK